MPITNHIRDNWCRFQGELFPEIQDAVGPLLKKYQRFVMALEIACPENFIFGHPKETVVLYVIGLIWREPL